MDGVITMYNDQIDRDVIDSIQGVKVLANYAVGYNNIDFKLIGEKFKKMDLSLIPIGTYEPKKFMGPVHISPEESIKIHKDVNSSFSIGMHWKTIKLSDEDLNLPPYELYLNLIKENINPMNFIAIDPGSYVNW